MTDPADRSTLTAPLIETIFAPEADGLAAWIWRLGAGQALAPPSAAGTGGQYLLVADGKLRLAAKAYEKWSAVFVTADEPPPLIVAGPEGLDLLVLQFPEKPGPHHAN